MRNPADRIRRKCWPSPPLKLAIFDFELEDFSAGASLAAGNPLTPSD